MRRGANKQPVVSVDKDDSSPKKIKEKSTGAEPTSRRGKGAKQRQTCLPSLHPEVGNYSNWLRRYKKATSLERIKVEDEAILDFLTHGRRRRGFIGRTRSIKAAAEPLNRLEQLLNKNLEKRRGRPPMKYKRDNQKFSLYLNTEFIKHLEDYSQKNGHLSMQEAVRDILRGYLRNIGYPV
jgi:hypothetical protein